jgi:hypothetical protein
MNQQAALNATDDPAMHAAIKQRMDLIVKATHPG